MESAAVKIGEDMLQVSSFGEYFYNGVAQARLPVLMADKYELTHEQLSKRKNRFTIKTGQQERIVLSSFKDMVKVDISHASETHFGSSVGLMGSFVDDGMMLARDGFTDMTFSDRNDYGQEWQVLSSEPKLFQDSETA